MSVLDKKKMKAITYSYFIIVNVDEFIGYIRNRIGVFAFESVNIECNYIQKGEYTSAADV